MSASGNGRGDGRPAPRLSFDRGTLLIDGIARDTAEQLPDVLRDPRVSSFRAPARKHKDIERTLRQAGQPLLDLVLQPPPALASSWASIDLRPYQQAALTA